MATGLTLEQLSAPIEADSGAGVLDRVRAAAATANELRGLGDELLDRYVQAARADGASWSEIGTALGVTKQAAHERFVDAPLAWPQNFNDPARAVVARALEEARGFGHRYLGTEHLLLALTAEPGLAGTTLAELGVSEHAVRVAIERIIGRGRSGGSATPWHHAAHQTRPRGGSQRSKARRSSALRRLGAPAARARRERWRRARHLGRARSGGGRAARAARVPYRARGARDRREAARPEAPRRPPTLARMSGERVRN